MSLFRVKTTECRVGVVGLANAGKTVFLTSLVNHLENHDPDRFAVGSRDTQLRKFVSEVPDSGWVPFQAAAFRDALVHKGRWPEKTRDRSQYVCRFERSDWPFSDALLKLYDLPGERLADAGMLGRTYAEWSAHVLGLLQADTPSRAACEPFFAVMSTPTTDDAGLLTAYKLSLANLILGYKPLVSPSTFLLDTSGNAAKPLAAWDLATSRHAGLDAASEFCPLPAAAIAARPQLAALFASRYETYRETVVAPFVTALQGCHSLVVLVDVTTLLAAGVGMYDDCRQILRDLFDVLDPGESLLEAAGRHLAKLFLPHDLRPGGIRRVAFVAPKLDLVHPLDRDRVLGLLKRLVGKLAADRDGLRADFFNTAAVVSTTVLPGAERLLVGVPYRDASGKRTPPGPEQRFAVSAVPDDWPADWAAGQYTFPEVYPAVPPRKDCPPVQIGLDKVLSFVLD